MTVLSSDLTTKITIDAHDFLFLNDCVLASRAYMLHSAS